MAGPGTGLPGGPAGMAGPGTWLSGGPAGIKFCGDPSRFGQDMNGGTWRTLRVPDGRLGGQGHP